MKCPACESEADFGKPFCAMCGAPVASGSVEDAIEQILKRKYQDVSFLEIQTTERIATRVQAWAKLFGFALAIPATMLLITLSAIGLSTYSDVKAKLADARAKAEHTASSAGELEKKVLEVQSKLDAFESQLASENTKIKKESGDFEDQLQTLKEQTKRNSLIVEQVAESQKNQGDFSHRFPSGGTDTEHSTDEEFESERTNELALARSGRRFFQAGDYASAIRFYEQAKEIEASGVWLSDYPFLAGAYLFTGKQDLFTQALQAVLNRVGRQFTYLGHRPPISFLLNSLGELRATIKASGLDPQKKMESIKTVDQTIDAVRAKLEKVQD